MEKLSVNKVIKRGKRKEKEVEQFSKSEERIGLVEKEVEKQIDKETKKKRKDRNLSRACLFFFPVNKCSCFTAEKCKISATLRVPPTLPSNTSPPSHPTRQHSPAPKQFIKEKQNSLH